MDELFEVLTLIQTGKHDPMPVVFLDAPGGQYWKSFDTFLRQELLEGGMISPHDTALYSITDRCEEAVAETVNFYKVYHGMRYVKDQLVFRLQQPLSDAAMAHLHEHFSDVLVDGGFRQSAALPEEKNEPELADLPRLVFAFNRRSLAKLRLMIDYINQQA